MSAASLQVFTFLSLLFYFAIHVEFQICSRKYQMKPFVLIHWKKSNGGPLEENIIRFSHPGLKNTLIFVILFSGNCIAYNDLVPFGVT